RRQVINYCKKSAAPIINTTITDYTQLLTTHVYQRAGWVLHMLRREIGEEAFWNGIREYYLTFQNGNALTSDFQHIMEKASDKNLGNFFKQWLERVEIPSLKVSWAYVKKSQSLELIIEQTQPGNPFDLQLEIGIMGNNQLQQVETVKISGKSLKTSIPVKFSPEKLVLDPNTNLLFEDISKN